MVTNRLSRLRVALALLAASVMTGCSTVGYYSQAVSGHLALMRARVPVEEALADPATAPDVRRSLEVARDARAFAVSEIGLPDNGSYKTWVDLGRPAVTWNVVATQAFSVDPETWCFPVAGCLSYRGYFSREAAEDYAETLAAQGLDTSLSGSTAYSSLGWFKDPLVSTMFRGDDVALAGVLFHELAHQLLYVADDSSFNESFASFVEQAGVEVWLRSAERPDLLEPWQARKSRRGEFIALLSKTRDHLAELYRAGGTHAELSRAKRRAFDSLRAEYAELKTSWGGYAGYDHWFSVPLNNARLAGVGTYTQWVDAFAVLFDQSGRDFQRFFDAADALSQLPRAERRAQLTQLTPE